METHLKIFVKHALQFKIENVKYVLQNGHKIVRWDRQLVAREILCCKD